MTVGKWNQVLEILAGQPWKDINPLIVDIHQQLQYAVSVYHQQSPGLAQPHLEVVRKQENQS
jgi:hypothetical protein